jgi:hypothetical protein
MMTNVIVSDVGEMHIDIDTQETKFVAGWLGQGYGYKNELAFDTGVGTCYIPESGFERDFDCEYDDEHRATVDESMRYTKQDFIDMCGGNEDAARNIFESVDWQSPETLVEEYYRDGELDDCEKCGKVFWCYEATKCSHCGAEYDWNERFGE